MSEHLIDKHQIRKHLVFVSAFITVLAVSSLIGIGYAFLSFSNTITYSTILSLPAPLDEPFEIIKDGDLPATMVRGELYTLDYTITNTDRFYDYNCSLRISITNTEADGHLALTPEMVGLSLEDTQGVFAGLEQAVSFGAYADSTLLMYDSEPFHASKHWTDDVQMMVQFTPTALGGTWSLLVEVIPA